MMTTELNELAKALATAQSQMQPALLDAVNPAFRSKYATLASVWEAVRPILAKNGLCVIQRPEHHEAGLALTTTILHVSGQSISSTLVMPVVKRDPQGFGSAITYARRYGLCAMLGVVADEDDDGNAASNPGAKRDRNADRGNDRAARTSRFDANVVDEDPAALERGLKQRFFSSLAVSANALGVSREVAFDWLKHSLAKQGIKSSDELTEAQRTQILGSLSPRAKAEVSQVSDLVGYAVYSAAKARKLSDDEANDVVRNVHEALEGEGQSVAALTPADRRKLIERVSGGEFDSTLIR